MSLRATNILLSAVALLVAAGVLDLAGCFSEKISASRAAVILMRHEPTYRRVVCRTYKGGYWDYRCLIDSPTAGRFATVIKVDDRGIVDEGG